MKQDEEKKDKAKTLLIQPDNLGVQEQVSKFNKC